ncbi:MAG: PAS domain S-box protein [Candidatus Odinarchaeota archaeon]
MKDYRPFFYEMPNGIAYHKIVVDKNNKSVDYIFIDVNEAFEKIVGLKRENILGKRVTEVLPDIQDDGEDLNNIYRNIPINEEKMTSEYYSSVLNRWYLVETGIPEKEHVFTVFTDITGFKETKESAAVKQQLQENELAFHSLAESIPAGIVIVQDNKLKYMNEEIERISGFTREELKHWALRDIYSVIYPVDQLVVLEQLKKKQTGETAGLIPSYSVRFTSKDERIKWIEIHSRTIIYEGKPADLVILLDINDRKRAEKALLESEWNFRTLAENANDGILIALTDGNQVYINKRATEITGYSNDELLNINMADLVHPDDIAILRNIHQQNLEGKLVPNNYEIQIVRKDGTIVPIEVSEAKTEWHGQNASIVVIRDITDRKRADRALQESEKRYRSFFEESPISLWELDCSAIKTTISELDEMDIKDFNQYFKNHPEVVNDIIESIRVVNVNKTTLKLFKATSKNELVNGLKRLFVLDTYKTFVRALVVIQRKEPFFQVETMTRTLTGDENHIFMKWTVMPGHEKTLSRILVSIIDITDRVEAEEALRESEERFRALFNNSQELIYVHDLEGNFLDANDRALDLLGYDRDTILSLSFSNILKEEDIPRAAKSITDILEKGVEAEVQEYCLETSYGHQIWVEPTGVPIERRGKPVAILGIARDITKRKQVEEALRASEEKLRRILDSSPDGIIVTDLHGIVTDCNLAALRLCGFTSKEELVGRDSFDFVAPRDRQRAATNLKLTVKKGPLKNLEYILLTKDGKEYFGEISSNIIFDSSGKPSSLLAVIEDITVRKQIDEALRESEQRYRELVEKLHEGVVVIDPGGTITFVNPKMIRLLDYTREELIDQHWNLIFPPEERPKASEEKAKRFKGISSSYETVLLTKNGQKIPVIVSSTPLFTFYETFRGVLALFIDISELKRAENALKESEEKYRKMVEEMPIGLYRTAPKGKILAANPALVDMLGYDSFEELAKIDLEQEGQISGYPRYIFKEQMELEGEIKGLETGWKKKNGVILYVRENARAIRDRNGEILYYEGTVEDITDRKRIEEMLEKQKEENELLLSIMTHDLKNYHLAATGFLDLALAESLTPDVIDILEQARASVIRSSTLTDNVSIMMKERVPWIFPLKRLDLMEIISKSKIVLDELFPEKIIEIVTVYISFDTMILADSLFDQLILNLLINAAKSDPREIVKLEIKLEETPGNKHLLSITDYGKGIPPERRDKLFERYKVLNKNGKGSSLGLFIVKMLIDRYNGKIWIESRVPEDYTQGTRIYVELSRPEERNSY